MSGRLQLATHHHHHPCQSAAGSQGYLWRCSIVALADSMSMSAMQSVF